MYYPDVPMPSSQHSEQFELVDVGLLTAGSGDVCHLNLPHVLLHVLNVEVLHLHLPDAPAGLPIGALDNILGDEQLDLLEWVHQVSQGHGWRLKLIFFIKFVGGESIRLVTSIFVVCKNLIPK